MWSVSAIFNVKHWRNLETWVRGRSRSLKMAPIDRSYRTLFWYNSLLQHFELFDVQNIVTLKSRLGVIEGHWKWHHSIRLHTSSYSSSIVTMAVSCTVLELKRDIGRKTPIFHTPFYLTCTVTYRTLSIFFQNFNANCLSPWAIRWCRNIYKKLNSVSSVQRHRQTTDRRQTNGSCRMVEVT